MLVEGEHCSDRERRAEEAERELTKLKLLHYLSDRIGDQMDAIVTGVEEFGIFARGIHLPAEGLVPIHSLEGDRYRFERTRRCLVGFRKGNMIRLGDTIRVSIERVDLEARQLDLHIIHHAGDSSVTKRTHPAKQFATVTSKRSNKGTKKKRGKKGSNPNSKKAKKQIKGKKKR